MLILGMLLDSIANLINKNINEYNTKISEKYGLDIDELQALWLEVSGSSSKKKSGGRKKKEDTDSENEEKPKPKKETKSKKNVEGGCPYVFIKGKNEGNTCGSKPKDGATYCSRHSSCEGVGQKEKKKIPTAKKISEKATPKAKISPEQKPKIVIRMNKDLDKYWNPESCLVFKSKDERVVIGSYRDEKFEKLNEEDIALCEKYGFKYEKQEDKVEKKEEKKVEKKEEKKSISEQIQKTNLEAEHIENVLNEICDDEEEVNEEEEVNDEEDVNEDDEEYVEEEEEMLEEDEE